MPTKQNKTKKNQFKFRSIKYNRIRLKFRHVRVNLALQVTVTVS